VSKFIQGLKALAFFGLYPSKKIQCLFITGIAGNNIEGYIAKSQFFNKGKWYPIFENAIEITGLLSKLQIENIILLKSPNIKDIEITEEEFLKSAEVINNTLHENSINKDYRARFISAILLAMSEGKDIVLTEETSVLIATINKRVELLLKKHKKHSFSKFIKIDEPSNPDNHTKVKKAIVKTYQELLGLNIRSAMRSGKDVLGKFYEAFLKYGNGAKEIGIVLTPRHITKFAAEILDISANDLVLDPACGTGGFLVAAYDEVQQKTKKEKDFEDFKLFGLYGVEEQDPIISLAIVNMIFRGDGKNNMIEGNCFNKWLNSKTEDGNIFAEFLTEDENTETRINPVTKVLMNPPFAKPNDDDKEYKFIEHALKQMQDGGILFSVLPLSTMFEGGADKAWRETSLLVQNTLISVVTFPADLFNPGVNMNTLGLIIKKGIPHPKKQNVLWARAVHDGLIKKKGKRLPNDSEPNDFEYISPILKQFIKNPKIKGNCSPF
jgi:type I restriction-modification system DNA methylase subunit